MMSRRASPQLALPLELAAPAQIVKAGAIYCPATPAAMEVVHFKDRWVAAFRESERVECSFNGRAVTLDERLARFRALFPLAQIYFCQDEHGGAYYFERPEYEMMLIVRWVKTLRLWQAGGWFWGESLPGPVVAEGAGQIELWERLDVAWCVRFGRGLGAALGAGLPNVCAWRSNFELCGWQPDERRTA